MFPVPTSDTEAFARALIALLDDDARREAMGRAGREKALSFSWHAIVDQTLELYSEVLARK